MTGATPYSIDPHPSIIRGEDLFHWYGDPNEEMVVIDA